MTRRTVGGLLVFVLVAWGGAMAQPPPPDCSNVISYTDPTYGGTVVQLLKPDGNEHNLYYYRNVWNADQTFMLGVQESLDGLTASVVLYNGDGCFIRVLFQIVSGGFWWTGMVWDRTNPALVYTYNDAGQIWELNVVTATQRLVTTVPGGIYSATTLSLNQAGDRIVVAGVPSMPTADYALRSFRLPGGDLPQILNITFPPGCNLNVNPQTLAEWRYTSYQDQVAVSCIWDQVTPGATDNLWIYNMATGALVKQYPGKSTAHMDFSPDGQWLDLVRFGLGLGVEVHVVNVDGTNRRIAYVSNNPEIRGLHVSWSDQNANVFYIALFPFEGTVFVPGGYDELIRCTVVPLQCLPALRTMTVPGANFWAQPLGSPSADGSRASFNSNKSGTIDQFIFLGPRG